MLKTTSAFASLLCAVAASGMLADRRHRVAGLLALQSCELALACAASRRLSLCWVARCAYVGAAIGAYGCSLCEVVLGAQGRPLALFASAAGAPVLAAVLTATLDAARSGPPSSRLLADAPDPCAVCLDACRAAQVCRTLACGHCFHDLCLAAWTTKQPTCPMCRATIGGAPPF